MQPLVASIRPPDYPMALGPRRLQGQNIAAHTLYSSRMRERPSRITACRLTGAAASLGSGWLPACQAAPCKDSPALPEACCHGPAGLAALLERPGEAHLHMCALHVPRMRAVAWSCLSVQHKAWALMHLYDLHATGRQCMTSCLVPEQATIARGEKQQQQQHPNATCRAQRHQPVPHSETPHLWVGLSQGL